MAPLVIHILLISSLLRQQTYFAFVDKPTGHAIYGLVILGWCVVALLGLLYTFSPRLRKTLPRYFWNHRFYQDAVRRGREAIPVETTVLLIAISGAIGLFAAVWLDQIHMSEQFTAVVRSLPPAAQTVVTALVPRAWITVILAGALTGLTLILWAGWLFLIANRLGQPVRYDQAFMLTVWPHWILLIPAGLAWITAGTAAVSPGILFLTWILGTGYATLRVWIDFHIVTRVPLPYIIVLALGSPLCLAAIVILVLISGHGVDGSALWQLTVGA